MDLKVEHFLCSFFASSLFHFFLSSLSKHLFVTVSRIIVCFNPGTHNDQRCGNQSWKKNWTDPRLTGIPRWQPETRIFPRRFNVKYWNHQAVRPSSRWETQAVLTTGLISTWSDYGKEGSRRSSEHLKKFSLLLSTGSKNNKLGPAYFLFSILSH